MMTTTTMIQFILIVLLINSINSQSANSQRISLKKNNNENNSDDDDVRLQNQQPRKLSHVVENITHSNYINDDGTISEAAKSNSNIHDLDEEAKEYQYFNDASAVSTPKYDLSNYDLAKYESPKYESLQYAPANYEPTKYGPPLPPLPASIEIPNNYKIDESDLTHSYYSQLEPTSYDPSDTFIRNRPVHAIPSSLYDQQPISPGTSISEVSSIHSVPGRIIKVTHHPIWAPDVQRLESQYFETYRAIKSSVLSFYYKMQYILNYVMGLFAFAETSPYTAQGRADDRGSKMKFKKKYRRFLLPLLLAYKLKFFTLIPLLIGLIVLLVNVSGAAGFFFALFAAVIGLKGFNTH